MRTTHLGFSPELKESFAHYSKQFKIAIATTIALSWTVVGAVVGLSVVAGYVIASYMRYKRAHDAQSVDRLSRTDSVVTQDRNQRNASVVDAYLEQHASPDVEGPVSNTDPEVDPQYTQSDDPSGFTLVDVTDSGRPPVSNFPSGSDHPLYMDDLPKLELHEPKLEGPEASLVDEPYEGDNESRLEKELKREIAKRQDAQRDALRADHTRPPLPHLSSLVTSHQDDAQTDGDIEQQIEQLRQEANASSQAIIESAKAEAHAIHEQTVAEINAWHQSFAETDAWHKTFIDPAVQTIIPAQVLATEESPPASPKSALDEFADDLNSIAGQFPSLGQTLAEREAPHLAPKGAEADDSLLQGLRTTVPLPEAEVIPDESIPALVVTPPDEGLRIVPTIADEVESHPLPKPSVLFGDEDYATQGERRVATSLMTRIHSEFHQQYTHLADAPHIGKTAEKPVQAHALAQRLYWEGVTSERNKQYNYKFESQYPSQTGQPKNDVRHVSNVDKLRLWTQANPLDPLSFNEEVAAFRKSIYAHQSERVLFALEKRRAVQFSALDHFRSPVDVYTFAWMYSQAPDKPADLDAYLTKLEENPSPEMRKTMEWYANLQKGAAAIDANKSLVNEPVYNDEAWV